MRWRWLADASVRGALVASFLMAALVALVANPGGAVPDAGAAPSSAVLTLSILDMVKVGADTYAGTSDGVYRATNVANNPPSSWTLFRGGSNGLPVGRVTSLAYDPEDNNLYAAVESVGIYITKPPQMNWQAYGTLPLVAPERITTISLFGTSHLYVGTNAGRVYQSMIGKSVTAAWSLVGAQVNATAEITSLLRVGEHLWAGTTAGLYYTDSTSPAWVTGSGGSLLAASRINDIVYASPYVFVATQTQGVLRIDPSDNPNWQSWWVAPAGTTNAVSALSPYNGSIMAAAGSSGGRSALVTSPTTGAAAWSVVSASAGSVMPVRSLIAENGSKAVIGTSQGPYVLVDVSGVPTVMAAGTFNATLAPTATRTPTPLPTATVPRSVSVPSTGPLSMVNVKDVVGAGSDRYFSSTDSLYRSSDIASSPPGKWELFRHGFGQRQVADVVALAYDQERNNLYAASASYGVYRTSPPTISWKPTDGLKLDSGEQITALAMYGTSELYAGSSTGKLYLLTLDFGGEWYRRDASDAPMGAIRSLIRVGDLVYAGTDSAIWRARATDSTLSWVQEVSDTGRVWDMTEIDGSVFSATSRKGIMHRVGPSEGDAWVGENTRGGVTLPQQTGGFTYTLAVSGYVAEGGRWLMAAVVNPQGRSQLYRTRIPSSPVSAGDASVSWILATNYTTPPVTSLLADGHFSAVIGTVSGPYILNGAVVMAVSQIKASTVAPSPTPSPVPPTNTPQPTSSPAATQAANRTATAVATSASSAVAAGATPIAAPSQSGAAGATGNRGLPPTVGTLTRTKVAPSGGLAISGEAGMGLTVGANAFIADVDVVIASLTRPDPPGTLRYASRLAYAQQTIPMLDGKSLDEVPLYTTSDDARIWAVAGTPYDIRFVDSATGREISSLPIPFDLSMQYSLNDFPIGGSEFDLALGRWDEVQQQWVRLPLTPDGMSRKVRATLDTPGVIALMTLAPMSFLAEDGSHVYPTTGQSVAPAVFNTINGNGGAPRAGFPITAEIDNGNGVFSQHFSRARVDVIPGTGEVRLGNIGSTFLAMIGITFPGGPDEGSSPEHRYFPETGHYVSYGFLAYYDAINGPSSLGQPISPQMLDMAGKVVQYFTNGRLEWNASLGRVELGNLGEDLYRLMEERRAQGALDVLITADGSVPMAAVPSIAG